MKVNRIINKKEILTFNELLKGFNNNDYYIFPKLPLHDVIDLEILPYLNENEKSVFYNIKFDFIITDKEHKPLFGVQFDGYEHRILDDVIKKDIIINRICQIAELPVIRISDFQLEKIDSISILQFMVYRFIKYNKEMPRIKEKLNEEIENMSSDEKENIIENGFLDPTYDPEFQFDLEYPFPLKANIISELKNNYLFEDFLPENNPHLYWYTVFQGGNIPKDGIYTSFCYYGIYKGRSKTKNYSWKEGKLVSDGVEILKEDKIQFIMNWALKTSEEYDENMFPIEFQKNHGFMPTYIADIPGASIPSIAEAVSEYVCYKKVLDFYKTINNSNI